VRFQVILEASLETHRLEGNHHHGLEVNRSAVLGGRTKVPVGKGGAGVLVELVVHPAQHPYVENAGFVKLREITVGYEIPERLIRTMFRGRAESLRLELSGRNLKTWTKYTGMDPEVSNFGNQPLGRFQDVTPYPPSRLFFFSVISSF